MLPFNETWGYAHNAMTASDTGIVCDWTASGGASAEGGATSALGGRPTCVVAECEGHRENDVLPFANLSVPRGSDGDVGSYTNRRLYALLHPHAPGLPRAATVLAGRRARAGIAPGAPVEDDDRR